MAAPLNSSIPDSPTETLADVRDAMSRNDDFDPSHESYASGENVFEALAVLEALEIEGEVLA